MNRTRRDPHSWISLIGVVPVIGLCAGVFEPAGAPVSSSQADATPAPTAVQPQPGSELLALNGR